LTLSAIQSCLERYVALFLFVLAIGMLVEVQNSRFLLAWDILAHQKWTSCKSTVLPRW